MSAFECDYCGTELHVDVNGYYADAAESSDCAASVDGHMFLGCVGRV